MNQLSASFSPITEAAAIKAADAWRRYRAGGGPRDRIAADFLIAGHASVLADRLLTRDRGFYRRYFAGLRILDPAAAG
jgi:predicted nucleic acid-binding protein